MNSIKKKIKQEALEGKKTMALILFNRDKKALNYIKRIDGDFIISKRFISILGSWSFKMINVAADSPSKTIKEGLSKILGKKISPDQIGKIFALSAAYQRLSEMNYGKKVLTKKDSSVNNKPLKKMPPPITKQKKIRRALEASLFSKFIGSCKRAERKAARICLPNDYEFCF